MKVQGLTVIDPVAQGEKVRERIYNNSTNQRLVRRLREGRSYTGCTTIDVIGCDMLCSYCYVDDSFLTGKASPKNMLGKESKKGAIKPYTPQELANETKLFIEEHNTPKRIQITAAEPFLTPEWTIDLVRELAPFIRKNNEQIWIDTNGLDIVRNPEILKKLEEFKDVLRIFVSSKNSPEHYARMTRVDPIYSDTGFRCIDKLWDKEYSAYLQAIAALFFPDTFEWYEQRLSKMHKAAPLLLDLDRLSYLPLDRIRSGLQSTGLWDIRQKDTKIEKAWQEFLEEHYGKEIDRLFSVDFFEQDEALVRDLIFENKPTENCHLFKQN